MKEGWKKAVEDINNTLQLDPPYGMEDEQSAIDEITERQDGEDAFVDEDYVPEKNIGLKTETVEWLMDNNVPVPEKWEKRMNKIQKESEMTEEEKEMETTEAEPEVEKKAKKSKKEKASKVKKEKKAKKEKRAKNVFGHGIGTIADQIDQLLLKGCTMDEAKEAGIVPMRFHVHFSTLKRENPLAKVWKEGNKYFAAVNDEAGIKDDEDQTEGSDEE